MEENEVELMDYLNVIWKRKWIIIIPTLFCIIVAGVISFLLPQVWEIDALIQPGIFYIQTEEGRLEEMTVDDSQQIAEQINQGSYNNLIAADLKINIREIPKLKAEKLPYTILVRISLREKNIEKAKLIINSLFKYLKKELDAELDIVINGIDNQITSNQIEKLNIKEEIAASKKKLGIIKQRMKEINKEMNDIRQKIELLEKEQNSILKKSDRSEAESLAILLYFNEIQQSLRYHDTLRELLSSKKKEEVEINSEIEKETRKIKKIESEIDNLDGIKGKIDFTKLIKEPTSSLSPVSPRKKFNVLITGILALLIFTMLAFFVEYIKKQKIKV